MYHSISGFFISISVPSSSTVYPDILVGCPALHCLYSLCVIAIMYDIRYL